MTNAKIKRHVAALKELFPHSHIAPSEEFNGEGGGIWTGFGEDGVIEYWHDFVDENLQKYMDKHGLYVEPYDSATMMIYGCD